ncbi:MAG TPA: hypothetical protein VIL48_08450 [Acidimicrobiales bacterium]
MGAEVQRDEPPGGPDGGKTARDGAEDRRADDRPRLEVSGTQVCASALAAVSAAVVGSFLGVADTIIGAALASVVATVGGAVYSWWIRRTHQRLRQVDVARLRALAVNRTGAPGALANRLRTLPLPRIALPDGHGGDASPVARAAVWARDRWAALAQRRRGVLAGATIAFVAAMTLVTAVELVGQRPLAGDGSSASTSIGALLGGGDGERDGGDSDDRGDPAGTTVPGADGAADGPTATGPDGTAVHGGPATPAEGPDGTADPETGSGGDGVSDGDASDDDARTGAATPTTGATTSTTAPSAPAPTAPATTAGGSATTAGPSAASPSSGATG